MKHSIRIFFLGLCSLTLVTAISAQEMSAAKPQRAFEGVPFTDVRVTDEFWAPRIETNRKVSASHNIDWCENQTGRIDNFRVAAGMKEGEFRGCYFDDSDVYKVIEGLAYTLSVEPDETIEKKTREWIDAIAATQQPDGYLMAYFITAKPNDKWTDLSLYHELYCAGHMAEAAVAMARATGDDKLLKTNCKLMDLICHRYGPGPDQLKNVAGHPEIELALVKLYQYTGDVKYLNEAKFFVDCRGVAEGREKGLFGEYCQDHIPLREQSEIFGHAVRAMYLYAGATDVAGYFQDDALLAAMNRLWDNVTLTKMYVTGGVGSDKDNEGFRGEFYLPNRSAYAETCAAIGLVLWAQRMNLATGEARFADVMERALYNGVLSGYGLSGDSYFYVNPLASEGDHHRQPFFGCACCPTNVIRLVASMPGYVYATSFSDAAKKANATAPDTLVVNLMVGGTAKVSLGGRTVTVMQKTAYPFDGHLDLSLRADDNAEIRLLVRNPGCGAYLEKTVNVIAGQTVTVPFDFDMTVQRILANPKVEDDRGRTAVQRGPIVYCFEQCDNEVPVDEIVLAKDPKFAVEMKTNEIPAKSADDPTAGFADRSVAVITAETADGKRVTAVPYCVWDNRAPGKMSVWVRQDGLTAEPDTAATPWREADWTAPNGKPILYRPLEAGFLAE